MLKKGCVVVDSVPAPSVSAPRSYSRGAEQARPAGAGARCGDPIGLAARSTLSSSSKRARRARRPRPLRPDPSPRLTRPSTSTSASPNHGRASRGLMVELLGSTSLVWVSSAEEHVRSPVGATADALGALYRPDRKLDRLACPGWPVAAAFSRRRSASAVAYQEGRFRAAFGVRTSKKPFVTVVRYDTIGGACAPGPVAAVGLRRASRLRTCLFRYRDGEVPGRRLSFTRSQLGVPCGLFTT